MERKYSIFQKRYFKYFIFIICKYFKIYLQDLSSYFLKYLNT